MGIMETTIVGYMGYTVRDIWGSYYDISKTIFYLLKKDYNPKP